MEITFLEKKKQFFISLYVFEGVITKFENVVKGSPQFENKSVQAGAGSPLLSVSSSQNEVRFCEFPGQNNPQDFEVAVVKEVKLSVVNESNIFDVSKGVI